MKRCPQCNRVESDNTLSFCRLDGATLLRDTGAMSEEAGTIRFDSAALASELHTNILPQAITERTLDRATAPTVVLSPTAVPPATPPTHDKAPVVRKSNWWLAIVGVLAITLVAALVPYLKWFRIAELPPIQSIAVTPFINASGNADVEYLSDGMTETLINRLAQLPNLSVKARSSVFRYKGKEVDPQTVGNELGVQAILNGRVVQRGDDLTLYLSLVDTRTGNQIWGDQYNRKQADLISLQNEIGRDVSSKLRTKLSGADEEKLAKNYTENSEAYQLYLQGRFFWNKRTPQNIQKSIEYFQQAHYGYALNYLLPTKRIDEAISEVKRALELEPLSIPMGANLAGLYLAAGKNDLGLEQARKMVALEPNHVTAKIWLARAYCANGMYAEVISLSETSIATDPASNFFIQVLGYAYARSGRRSEAEEVVRKLNEIGKRQYMERFGAATIYAALGEKDKAFAELEKSFEARDWGIARITVDPFIEPLRNDPRLKDLVRRMRLPE